MPRAPSEATTPAAEPSAEAPTSSEASADDEADAPAAPAALQIDPASVPAFAKLDFDPKSLGPRRARIRSSAGLYSPSGLTPLSDTNENRGVILEVKVLDPDEGGQPRRPRVLCEARTARLGVAIDATALGVATVRNLFVRPYRARSQNPRAKTPGLRIAGGAEIDVDTSAGDLTKIAYAGLFLKASGWVDTADVDVVYVPDELPQELRHNGQIERSVKVLDSPHGKAIGTIDKDPIVANVLYVFRLGPARDGHTLVRYDEHDAYIVGWIPTGAIKAYPTKRFSGSGGGGGGSGSGVPQQTAALTRGMVLVPAETSEVIGVVTQDFEAQCQADCEGPHPRVWIFGCGNAMTLRAAAP
jgi:hypothetical protein